MATGSGRYRDVGGEGGEQCGKKNILYWALEARYDTAFNPLNSPVGAHIHKTTRVPLINTALV
jgi:hypothetical protein